MINWQLHNLIEQQLQYNDLRPNFFNITNFVNIKKKSNLAKTDENTPHGLEVEGFVAVEHQHEAAELIAESFYRLRFPRTRGSCDEGGLIVTIHMTRRIS